MIYSLKYTDSIPDWQGGYARAWFIRIRPKYRDDIGILEHEKIHVKQFWRTFGLYGLLYLCIKKYRLWSELKAYREQLKYPPANGSDEYRRDYARAIATNYGLDVSEEEAYRLLN